MLRILLFTQQQLGRFMRRKQAKRFNLVAWCCFSVIMIYNLGYRAGEFLYAVMH